MVAATYSTSLSLWVNATVNASNYIIVDVRVASNSTTGANSLNSVECGAYVESDPSVSSFERPVAMSAISAGSVDEWVEVPYTIDLRQIHLAHSTGDIVFSIQTKPPIYCEIALPSKL